MAEEPIDSFRFVLMQDLLPVGLAMMARFRNDGPGKVVEFFNQSTNPFEELRVEGERDAKIIRDRLDQVSPGLGNPVMEVNVTVDQPVSELSDLDEEDSLKQFLHRLEKRLDILEKQLQIGSEDKEESQRDSRQSL